MLKSTNWWVQNYGISACHKKEEQLSELSATLSTAIRNNNIESVRKIVRKHPFVLFTKIFGNSERTLLYTASFYGKFEIVKLLLSLGADPSQRCCGGYLPIDVASVATNNPVSKLKVQYEMKLYKSPAAVIVSKDVRKNCIVSKSSVALAIHFTEPVEEFAETGVELIGATIVKFYGLTDARYSCLIKIHASAGELVTIKAISRAAKRFGKTEYEAVNNPVHYSIESDPFTFYYCHKK